jgi:hypothetical protein
MLQIRAAKILTWVAAIILSVLIIASHKHYTVDITVAWYTVPLVFYALERRWTTRRGDCKGDTSDTQMKALREVLVKELDRSQHDARLDPLAPTEASAPSYNGALLLMSLSGTCSHALPFLTIRNPLKC